MRGIEHVPRAVLKIVGSADAQVLAPAKFALLFTLGSMLQVIPEMFFRRRRGRRGAGGGRREFSVEVMEEERRYREN